MQHAPNRRVAPLVRHEAPQDELIGNAFIKLSEIVDPEMESGKAGPSLRRYTPCYASRRAVIGPHL